MAGVGILPVTVLKPELMMATLGPEEEEEEMEEEEVEEGAAEILDVTSATSLATGPVTVRILMRRICATDVVNQVISPVAVRTLMWKISSVTTVGRKDT